MTNLPQRSCVICRAQKNKNELLRIVKNKDNIVKVDERGKESGRGEILEIYIGKGEDKGRFSEQGNKGKIIFEYWQPVTDRFWNSQYLKEFTLEK